MFLFVKAIASLATFVAGIMFVAIYIANSDVDGVQWGIVLTLLGSVQISLIEIERRLHKG